MKRLHSLLMMLFAVIFMVSCGEEQGMILPPNPNPVNPNPPAQTPSEFPLISTDPAFVKIGRAHV